MKSRLLFYFFFFTVALSTSQEWFPFVWSQFHGGDITYIGELKESINKCNKQKGSFQCRGTYSLSREVFNTEKLKGVLGLGFFLTDYKLLCGKKEILRSFSSKGYSLNFDSYKIYKTIDLKGLACPLDEKLYLNIYTYDGLRTFGQISSNALLGKREFVLSAKRAIEFLSTGIYVICSIFLIFSYFTKYILLKDFNESYKETYKPFFMFRGKIILFWFFFSLFKSGLVDIIASSPTSTDLLFRLQSFVSLVIHSIIPIYFMLRTDKKVFKIVSLMICILYIPFSFTSLFNYYLVYVAKFSALFGLMYCLRHKRGLEALFCFFVLIETSKVFNLSFLPPGSTTLLFSTLLYTFDNFNFLKVAGIFASANIWFRDHSSKINTHDDLISLFTTFSKEVHANRVTAFFLDKNDKHVVWTYDNSLSDLDITFLNYVPGPFAQVISADTSIMHENINSEYAQNLLKSEKSDYGDLFTIVPLKFQGKILGVIALSKYEDPSLIHDDFYITKIEAMISVFSESVSLVSRTLNKNSIDMILKETSEVVADYKNYSNAASFSDIGETILKLLKNKKDWKGFFGVLSEDKNVLEIISSTYENKLGGDFLKGQSWEMSKANVRAPAPLALHYGKTVFVPNVNWLNENISKNTKYLFQQTNMKSFVAIPIKRLINDENSSIALLWISSDEVGEFDNSFNNASTLLKEVIESDVERMINKSISENVFSNVIRQDIKSLLMKGHVPVEKGEGSLYMVDLVGSSKISEILGGEEWKKYQGEFFKELNFIGSQFGLTSETFVWDAINFTSNKILNEKQLIDMFLLMYQAVIELNKKYEVEEFIDPSKPIRFCATFGDITREVFNGAWDITGHAMARICKLEQSIKKQDILLSISHEYATKIEIDKLNKCQPSQEYHNAGLSKEDIINLIIKNQMGNIA